MPLQLLPKSAAAFAPRAKPTIVLGTKVESWLTTTLKRISKVKRPLNSVPQHFRALTEVLGGEDAIWTLASLLLPREPDAKLHKDSNPLMEAINNYNMLHIEAYVVHVDMVSQMEVAFKLTSSSIDALTKYHKTIYSVDIADSSYDFPEKESQIKKMQEDFVQAVNRFVFRTGVRALEGLEEDGAGELLEKRSDDVKKLVMNLFAPLVMPPPKIVDIIAPAHSLDLPSSSSHAEGWWQPQPTLLTHPAALGQWHVLPSTPSPTATTCSDLQAQSWHQPASFDIASQFSSPSPSASQPNYTDTTSMYASPPVMVTMPSLHYPSQLPHSCGSTAALGIYDAFGMGYSQMGMPQFATTT